MFTKKSKFMITLLALTIVFTMILSACSDSASTPAASSAAESSASSDDSKVESDDSKAESKEEKAAEADTDDTVYEFSNGYDDTVEIGTPATELDPAEVYKKCTYIPEMFLGEFQLLGDETVYESYKQDTPYYKFNEAAYGGGGVEREITAIPYEIEGKTYNNELKKDSTGYIYLIEAKFYTTKGDKDYRKFLYTVDSKKRTLTLNEIKEIKYNSDYDGITAYEEGQLKLTYTFEFKGLSLTLTKDDASVTLYTGYSDPKDPSPYLSINAYLTKGSSPIDHIVAFNFYKSATTSTNSLYITFDNAQNEEETSNYCHAKMTRDGLFTFSIPYATETKTYQYVYFYLKDKGIILTDGETNHKYTMKDKEFHSYKLGTVLDDSEDADALSDEEAKKLLIAQNKILIELEEAFAKKNIKAVIDKETGRVTLDSEILFDSDSYEVSSEGKTNLDEFLEVYTSVILSKENKDLVASIVVEGHTDTNGTHEYNQKLSENRAKAVADYCITSVPELKKIITSKGYSYDNPIFNDDGTVNMAASRRVDFKFKLEKKAT